MFKNWNPTADFARQANLWGMPIKAGINIEAELSSFIAYWQAEGKVFHHVQWQQKLARSIQINRANQGGVAKRDINAISQPDSQIPPGFRG